MKWDKDLFNKNWVSYTFATCSAVVLYLALSHIPDIVSGFGAVMRFASPVFTGLVIAYILNPLVKFLERTILKPIKSPKVRRTFSVPLSLILVLLFIVVIMIALIPQLVDSISTFISNLDGYSLTLQSLLLQLQEVAANFNINISGIVSSSDDLIRTITSFITNNTGRIVDTSVNIGSGLMNLVIATIMALYFLADKENLLAAFSRLMRTLMPARSFKDAGAFLARCNSIMGRYLVFDILDGVIVAVINLCFMLITDMPYAVLISVVVGMTNLAPTFGPIVGAVIGGFILVLVNPMDALIFLIFTLVLQTIDGYIIKPKLFGDQLGVSAVWILISIIIGGRIFGVAGILLAIPFAAIIDFSYRELWLPRLEKRRALKDAKEKEKEKEKAQASKT